MSHTKGVTEYLWKLLEDDRETSLLPYTIDNIHGTGLETCHVSALNVYKTKWPICVTGIRTSQVSKCCCLYTPAVVFIFER